MLPEKTKRDQNEYKTDMIEVKKKNIIKKNAVHNIEMRQKARDQIINLFEDYFNLISDPKFKTTHGEGLKILIPKQMLQDYQLFLRKQKAVTHLQPY